jgi:prepilin peptidase CpaA
MSALVDVRTRRVPNGLTLGIAACGVALAVSSRGPVGASAALGGLVVGFLLMTPGHFIGATGAGDVKLLAALGTLLGPRATVVAFVYASIAGGVLACAVAVRRRRLAGTLDRAAELLRTGGANVGEIEHASMDNRFAYAPAIALGAFVAALGV